MMCQETVKELARLATEEDRLAKGRYGIDPDRTLGVRLPEIRKLAKKIGTDHQLACELWKVHFNETQQLASMIADPKLMQKADLENWVVDLSSWDVCDTVCTLFYQTRDGLELAYEWCQREEEFVKRAGFVVMVAITLHKKKLDDNKISPFLLVAEEHAWDKRNFVKKAVNWLIRQIGKRSIVLNREALATCEQIMRQPHKSAKWIARDAIRELSSDAVQKRLHLKSMP
ncbi:MAG: DNA alkylation repair protein [Cyclobacteriaceae bacterium]